MKEIKVLSIWNYMNLTSISTDTLLTTVENQTTQEFNFGLRIQVIYLTEKEIQENLNFDDLLINYDKALNIIKNGVKCSYSMIEIIQDLIQKRYWRK